MLFPFIFTHQRTADTTKPTLNMEITLLVIIQWVALNSSLFDELGNILVAPLKYRIYRLNVFLFASVESAIDRFFVYFCSFPAFRFANANNNHIKDFIFFKMFTTEAHTPIRETFLFNKFKECYTILWSDNLTTLFLAVLDRTHWVNSGVFVDGTVFYASHFREFKDNIAILSSRIRHLYNLVAYRFLYQRNGLADFFL